MAGRGGRRPGAGRPVGSGKYGEPTKAVRVPESMVPHLSQMIKEFRSGKPITNGASSPVPDNVVPFKRPGNDGSNLIPLFDAPAAAGWTAISQDMAPSETVDLVRHLSHHPDSSFLVTVRGDSMVNAGINDGDLLLVDKDEEATHGRIVLAHHNDKMTVKRLHIAPDKTITLKAENPDHNNEVIREGDSFEVIATVVSVIRRF
ncbi:MAG: S24 family peptidase [Cyanobacteria bacterium P01_F01_bin.153]